MHINLPYKHYFTIVGIPRSGTTLINNVFNSLENGFCISEPVLAERNFPNRLKFDKVQNLSKKTFSSSTLEIERILIESEMDLGGFKETYRFDENNCDDIWNNSLIDFIIFVVRNPLCVFSSFERQIWQNKYSSIEWLKLEYIGLHRKYLSQVWERPSFIIKYEDFCLAKNKIDYLNNIFDGYLTIEGEFKLNPSRYKVGDHKAITSSFVDAPNMELTRNALHKPNKDYIESNILPIYEKFVDLQNPKW